MLGYVIWRGDGRPRVTLERRAIGGASFLLLEAHGTSRRTSRRVLRALDEMAARGVRRYVMAPDWPSEWREGLTPVEEDTLRQAMLPALLDWLAVHRGLRLGDAAVEITAPWANRAVWEAACLLSRRCRYLRLRMEGAEVLREDLWRRFGIAAGGEGAALRLCFGEPEGVGPVLLLGPGCGERQRAVYDVPPAVAALGDTYPLTSQLIAALWQGGGLRVDEIGLRWLDFSF